MRILAVDTTSSTGSVALLEGPIVRTEWTVTSTATHNRRLLNQIHGLLEQAGWSLSAIDGFGVTLGPGSFTGVRIGLTTVKTLAWASSRPLVGIPSLDALAAPFEFARHPVCPLIDARKGEVYFALYHPDGNGRLCLRGEYAVASPERVARLIKGPTIFCGDGWLLYEDVFRKILGDEIPEAAISRHGIRAAVVGALALRRLARRETDDPITSTPVYVRPSEAEINHPHLATHLKAGNRTSAP